jgi:phosphohistidine phosphatase
VLYVLRHGIAEERRAGLADAKRALTDEGRDKLKGVLLRARAAGVECGVILSSPLVRARQTARIAADLLKCRRPMVETKALLPRASAEAAWAAIRTHGSEGPVLVAGHEPHLSTLIGYVLSAPNLKIDLKKAALVKIRFEQSLETPHGILEWILAPRLARGSG